MTVRFTTFTNIVRADTQGNGPIQAASNATFSGELDDDVSTEFPRGTAVVRVVADADSWVSIGQSPDASADAGRVFMPANIPEYFGAEAGESLSAVSV